ncbi:MAG: hypothetical protein ABIY35_06330 [Chitinophagaceae bacterium]
MTLLLFCSQTFAQADSIVIKKIRKTVEQINKDCGYTIKILDNEEFMGQITDGGGQVTGYFKKGQLVKIDEFIGLSSCVNTTTYYLKDNKLIFVYTQGKEFQYVDSIATFNSSIQTVTMECRFYFENDKMIESIFKGATRCGGPPLDSWAKNYLDDTTRYIDLFTKKK